MFGRKPKAGDALEMHGLLRRVSEDDEEKAMPLPQSHQQQLGPSLDVLTESEEAPDRDKSSDLELVDTPRADESPQSSSAAHSPSYVMVASASPSFTSASASPLPSPVSSASSAATSPLDSPLSLAPSPPSTRRPRLPRANRYSSSRRHRIVTPLPVWVRWGGLLGASFVLALGMVAAALYLGILRLRELRGEARVGMPPGMEPASFNASILAAEALQSLNASHAQFETALQTRQVEIEAREAARLRQQEEFRRQLERFEQQIRALAEQRSKLDDTRRRMEQDDVGVDEQPSLSSSEPTATQASKLWSLRHSPNIHALARLLDKLTLGYPLRVGWMAADGEVSEESESVPTRLLAWMQDQWPVAQDAATRTALGIDPRDTRLAHQLRVLPVAPAVTAANSSAPSLAAYSFCNRALIPSPLPDLLLLDDSIVRGFSRPTRSRDHESSLPLQSADQVERLVRELLQRSELERRRERRESIRRVGAGNWTAELQMHSSLQATAIAFISSAPQGAPSLSSSLARRYGIPHVRLQDASMAPLLAELPPTAFNSSRVMQSVLLHSLQQTLLHMQSSYSRSGRSSLVSSPLDATMVSVSESESRRLTSSSVHPRPFRPGDAGDDSDESRSSSSSRSSVSKRRERQRRLKRELLTEARAQMDPSRPDLTRSSLTTFKRLQAPPIVSAPPLALERPSHPFNQRGDYRCSVAWATPAAASNASAAAPAPSATGSAPSWSQSISSSAVGFLGASRADGWELHDLGSRLRVWRSVTGWTPPTRRSPRKGSLSAGGRVFPSSMLANVPRITFRLRGVRTAAMLFFQTQLTPPTAAATNGSLALTTQASNQQKPPSSSLSRGLLLAWLTCDRVGTQSRGRSQAQLIDLSDVSDARVRAEVALLWPPPSHLESARADWRVERDEAATQWSAPTPPCAFTRMHIALVEPGDVLILGHAEA